MASGKLGSAALAADTDTTIYTCPAETTAVVNVNLCNRGGLGATVRVSIGAASPAEADYVEYGAVIPAGGVLERSGLVVGAGEVLVARANTGDVAVRAFGYEEEA
jgi:hypothetical protein